MLILSRRWWAVLLLLMISSTAQATPKDVYEQALILAGHGKYQQAISLLKGGANSLPAASLWQSRLQAASVLIASLASQQVITRPGVNPYLLLAVQYQQQHPPPSVIRSWWPTVLATVIPGAGHAWLGRWHDAITAAIMIWPMLLLTLWAWHRNMGPVTVFFAVITLWLWSGTVFSATLLSGRATLDAYHLWWLGVWQASGLPGHLS